MDENTQVMTEEATMPTEPVTEPADTQTADNPAEVPAEDPTEPTTPPTDPAADAEATPAPFMTGKFNHKPWDIMTKEEALAYAQLGRKREEEQPTWDALSMLAAGRGQSPQEFVESLMRYEEKVLLDEKRRITGGNEEEARKLFRVDLEARQSAYAERVRQAQEAEQQAEQSITDRLATEFRELREHFPDLAEFDHIPADVVDDAARNDRHLLDAYLRYQMKEGKKIEQNRAAQAAAAAASTGSLADTPPEDAVDAVTAAMLKGVWS